MSYLTIKDLNPDKDLSVAIAATFAVSVSHLYDNPVLREGVITLLEWGSYSRDELRDGYDLVWRFIDSISIHESKFLKPTYVPKSIAYVFSAALADPSPSTHAYYAIRLSYFALGLPNSEGKYIHNMLINLLPVILDYKISQSKVSFDNSEKVFELLDEYGKEKFLFDLDILK